MTHIRVVAMRVSCLPYMYRQEICAKKIYFVSTGVVEL